MALDTGSTYVLIPWDIACVVHDLPETSRVDGLLGLSFLKKLKLYLDFQAGILELE